MAASCDPVEESVFVDVNTEADDGFGNEIAEEAAARVGENVSEANNDIGDVSGEVTESSVGSNLCEAIFLKTEADIGVDVEIKEEALSPGVADVSVWEAEEGDEETGIKSEVLSSEFESEAICILPSVNGVLDGSSREVELSEIFAESGRCGMEVVHSGIDNAEEIQSPNIQFAVNSFFLGEKKCNSETLACTSKNADLTPGDTARKSVNDVPTVRTSGISARFLYQCNTCDASFYDKRLFSAHILTHMPFSCDVCLQMFATKAALRMHSKCHRYDSSYTCAVCKKSYNMQDRLKKHILASHHNKTPFGCPLCGLSFVEKNLLERHVVTHANERHFSCTFCNQMFRKRSHVARHMKDAHSIERTRYVCNDCDKVFFRKGPLKQHLKTHNKDPLTCTQCGLAFCDAAELKSHVLNHLILKSICHFKTKFSNICQKSQQSSSS